MSAEAPVQFLNSFEFSGSENIGFGTTCKFLN